MDILHAMDGDATKLECAFGEVCESAHGFQALPAGCSVLIGGS